MQTADLSIAAINRRALVRDCEPAVARLRRRAAHMEAQAAGKKPDSKARRDAAQAARHLRACAALLESDTEYGDRIRRALRDRNALDVGWQSLAQGVTIMARRFRQEFDAAATHPDLQGVVVGEQFHEARSDMEKRLVERYGRGRR